MENKNQIVILYIVLSCVSIIFLDQYINTLIKELNLDNKEVIHDIKRLFFIVSNALLLYYLLGFYNKKQRENLQSLIKIRESSKQKQKYISLQHRVLEEVAWVNGHTIRKPIASILSLMELNKLTDNPAEKDEYFRLMEHCVKDLDTIICEVAVRLNRFSQRN